MQTLFAFLIRLVLLAAGLVFAASLLVAAVVLAVAWVLGSAWARLTGRPVTPFVMRVDPRTGFGRMHRRPAEPAPARPKERALDDVTDVEAKPPRAEG
jgi:hypothetical protein